MEKFELENFPTSESAKKMLSYVSDGFYDESYVGKWIFQVMGVEYDKVLEIVTDLPAQFFPETATWGLMYHEIKWGLPVRLNLSYEERRRLIYQKRDYRAPMTPYRMEKYLEDATGFEVHIADVNDPGEYDFVPPHPNVFKAYFLGEDSLDSKVVFEILNRLKQSHTAYIVNDRIELDVYENNLQNIALRNIRFQLAIPFFPYRSYDGILHYNGMMQYGAKRKYNLGVGLRLYYAMRIFKEEISSVTIETRRNVRYYNGKKRYDGSARYNAMVRKDLIE
ncbi:MAG: YmfQ family protein [Acetatifactor sp.]|nr:YmfQ family protein [Acetatifactor sp.]